jgi:hypothetical protein
MSDGWLAATLRGRGTHSRTLGVGREAEAVSLELHEALARFVEVALNGAPEIGRILVARNGPHALIECSKGGRRRGDGTVEVVRQAAQRGIEIGRHTHLLGGS